MNKVTIDIKTLDGVRTVNKLCNSGYAIIGGVSLQFALFLKMDSITLKRGL